MTKLCNVLNTYAQPAASRDETRSISRISVLSCCWKNNENIFAASSEIYTIILQTPGGKKQENFIQILPFDGSAALC
jgi:hypothetical protein